MIDRSYLPYKSAREYKDRGMAKWMGFFISEHSTALSKERDTVDFYESTDDEEKILYLTQAFLNRKKILLYTTLKKEPFIGTVYDMTAEKLYLNTADLCMNFLYSQILRVTIAEVPEDE